MCIQTPVDARPFLEDGSLRPGDLRVAFQDDHYPHGFGIFRASLDDEPELHIYPVIATQEDESSYPDLLDEYGHQVIPLSQIALVQRCPSRFDGGYEGGVEIYNLVHIRPATSPGSAPRVDILPLDLCPLETSFYYFQPELDAIPPHLRNMRAWLAHHVPTLAQPPRYLDTSLALPDGDAYHIDVVLNPHAGKGNGAAKQWWRSVVLPILSEISGWADSGTDDLLSWKEWETEKAGDGERVGREIAERLKSGDEEVTGRKHALMVLGGDGTTQEVLNGLLVGEDGETRLVPVELVVLPLGTANALYSHLFPPTLPAFPSSSPLYPLHSLLAFLTSGCTSSAAPPVSDAVAFTGHVSPPAEPLPLALALNTLPSTAPSVAGSGPKKVLTAVVTSASLHASILHDAEALRASHPGVERFKLAAQKNATRWTDGKLTLRGRPRLYDPTTEAWVDKGDAGGIVEVDGAFAYLTAALVDRFEPNFVVAPFRSPRSALSPSSDNGEDGSIDLVLVRPLRHAPTAALAAQGGDAAAKAREEFVKRVWEVSGAMYDGGKHVALRYGTDEGGETIVELWRAGGFEWKPAGKVEGSDAESALKGRLVCLDGAVHDLGDGGALNVEALGTSETGVRVWA
ncbi:hypothetical protein JCM10207_005805 [Rhodosporidiobolus poonsookiae]